MKFKQSVFIKKNTQELQNKLKKLGYKYGGCDSQSVGNSALYCYYDTYYEIYPSKPARDHKIIDCGYNDELFLALAALRSDSDMFQWFICTEEYISTHTMDFVKVGTWQLNTQHNKLSYGLKRLWKKATIKEIIEHFS